MSVDDPSAKDSVVLGADLVEALGFEPVGSDSDVDSDGDVRAFEVGGNGQRADSLTSSEAAALETRDDTVADEVHDGTQFSATPAADITIEPPAAEPDLVVDDADDVSLFGPPPSLGSNGVSPLDHEVGSVDSAEQVDLGDEAVVSESSVDDLEYDDAGVDSFAAEPSGVAEGAALDIGSADPDELDDLEQDEEPIVAPPVVEEPSRGRFGVRGLFSRNAESVADDLAVPAEAQSTRALFEAESGQALVDGDVDDDADGEPTELEPVGLGEADTSVDAAPVDEGSVDEGSFDGTPVDGSPVEHGDDEFVEDDLLDDEYDDEGLPEGDDELELQPVAEDDDGEWSEDEMNDTTTVPLQEDLYEDELTTESDVIDLDEATRQSDVVIIDDPAPDDLPLLDDHERDGAVVAPAAARGRGATKLRARKARRVIRHIDPWSVLVFSVVFHLAFFAALLLAGVLVWNAALAAGTIESIENFVRELADLETFEINSDQVFKAAVAIATMLTLASSVLVVLLTVVFNLISDLIGGIRVTVIEEETVRVRSSSE